MSAQAIGEALAACYREIEATAMRDAPICNAALQVVAIGFRDFDGYAVGIVLTPWFLNLVVAELPSSAMLPIGALRLAFPAGAIDFTVTELAGFGRLASCSLFSPLFDFPDQETARAVSQAALDALFNLELHAANSESRRSLDRRAFLSGLPLQRDAAS
jgi:[NiFe] hydrogenase assembly HybE family chaperone